MRWWEEWLKPKTVFWVLVCLAVIAFMVSDRFQAWVLGHTVGLGLIVGFVALISFVFTGSFTFKRRVRR